MKTIFKYVLAILLVVSFSSMKPADMDEWIRLFDGKTFNGWKINKEHPDTFTIKDGRSRPFVL